MEQADNCRIESEFGICRAGRAGKELRLLWKSTVQAVDGLCIGDVGVARKRLMDWEETKGSRSQRSLRDQKATIMGERKLGNWECRRLGGITELAVSRSGNCHCFEKDPGSEGAQKLDTKWEK